MTQKIAAGSVDIDGHVGLASAQRAAASDVRDVVAECLGVEGVAQSEKGGELRKRIVVEAVEVGQITALVDLVNVGLLGGEGDVGLDLVADLAQESVVDQAVDNAVLIGTRGGILFRVFV